MPRLATLTDWSSDLTRYGDPFALASRDQIPRGLHTALDYARVLYHITPMYRPAYQRIVGHFVNRLTFRGEIGSRQERESFEKLFVEVIGGLEAVRLSGEEYGCYGNSFVRVNFPFTRLLMDRRRGYAQLSLASFPEEQVKFDLQTMTYEVPDPMKPGSSARVRLPFRDVPSADHTQIRVRTLDPRYCRLRYSEASGDTQVEYLFDPDFRSRVRGGRLFEINRTPVAMLKAIRDNKAFLFNRDSLFHLKTQTIAGVSNEGWGLPEILAHYPTIHRIAVYDAADEAISREMVTPFRVLAPNLDGLQGRQLESLSAEWIPAARRMIDDHRKDPTSIQAYPFPLHYQQLGGDAKTFTPKDLKEYEVNQLMRQVGIPPEMLDGSLSIQHWPAAIRAFEQTFMPLSGGLSRLTNFLVAKISKYMYNEAFDAVLTPSAAEADMERRAILFNFHAAGELPRRLTMKELDLENPVELRLERAREDYEIERKLMALQAEEERKAMMGSLDDVIHMENEQAAEGGGAPPGGGSPVVTPTDLRAQAEELAQQWLAILPDGERSRAMQQVRSTDPDKYAVAKDIMEQIRAQGASEGRQMAAQQFQE